MPAYGVGCIETSWGRCAWCWDELSRTETHTVVTSLTAPLLVLHMHHPCFDSYRYTSGLELAAVGSSKEWPPERLEQLRITLGWDLRRFCLALGVTEGTYHRILKKDASVFGPGVQAKVKQLSAKHKFESQSVIDWSDPRALFCLRMTLDWKFNKLARAIGASSQQLGPWERAGVPQRSVRTWGRLAKLAKANNFESSNILDDHLWTRRSGWAKCHRSVGAGETGKWSCRRRLLDPGDPAVVRRDTAHPPGSGLEAHSELLGGLASNYHPSEWSVTAKEPVHGAPATRAGRRIDADWSG